MPKIHSILFTLEASLSATPPQVGKATPEADKPMFIRQRTLAEYPIFRVAKGSQ